MMKWSECLRHFKLEVVTENILPLEVEHNGYLYPIFFFSPHFSRDIYKDSYLDWEKVGNEDPEGKEKN